MATVPISDGDPKNTYTATGGQTTFAYTFWIKDEDHLAVYVNGTLKTITTDYTVSAVQSVSGANVVFNSGLTLNDVVVIVYDPDFERTAEYTGTIRLDALNVELTYLLTLLQSNKRQIDDAIRFADTETGSVSGALPALTGNGLKVLRLKSDLSGIEFGPTTDNLDTLAAISSDISTVAGISANVTTVAGISANVTTVAGISSNVTTVAGISSNVTSVAGNATNINTVAADLAGDDDIGTVAASIADVEAAALALASAFKFTFDSSTTMADPGTGDLRLNNATLASVTSIAFDATSALSGNPDVSDFIASWDDSTNTIKGQLRIAKGSAPQNYALFNVTAVTDNTGWLEVTVTHVDSNGSFTNGDSLYISFARSGDAGDVVGPVSSTDNAIVRWDGTGGATAQNSGVTISDTNFMSGVTTMAVGGDATLDSAATALQISYIPTGDFTPATNTAYEALAFKGNNNGYAGMRISAPNSGAETCAIAMGDEASAISGLMGYAHGTDQWFFGHGFTNWMTATSSLVQFRNSGNEVMRLDGGKVGINMTSTPSYRLQVQDNVDAETAININNTNTGGSAQAAFRATSGSKYFISSVYSSGTSYFYGNTSLVFGAYTDTDNIQFLTGASPTTKLTIANNGNAGIGTQSPDTLLHLGATNAALTIKEHGSAPSTPDTGDVVVYAKADGRLYLKNDAGTETDLTGGGGFTVGPEVATTSGTSVDITSIPSGTKVIMLNFDQVSTNGSDNLLVQIGDSGGVETTGYLGSSSTLQTGGANTTAYTAGFGIRASGGTNVLQGTIILTLQDSTNNVWAVNGMLGASNAGFTVSTGGSKALSAELDRVRLTTTGGTDTFDAGAINITYAG